MLFEFTPSLTTFFVKTSKQPVQVQTVCLKVCDVRLERTSEQQLVSSEGNELFHCKFTQNLTSQPVMHFARRA